LNSDAWLTRKKGQPFMPLSERFALVSAIGGVDEVIVFNDDDGSSIDAIRLAKARYPDSEIIFSNGGDRTAHNIPEMSVNDVVFKFGVGGDNKKNSSSWILDEWKSPKTLRPWGYYRILHEVDGTKVKELTIDPGKSLSLQRHKFRAEYWHVTSGQCVINAMMPNGYYLPTTTLGPHGQYKVPLHEWHQLTNPFDEPCKIVEIQYGEQCVEEDIERKDA